MSNDNSYGQILRSSTIIGGAHGLNYLVGLIRVKIVAVLLGPAGVGLISLYTSATSLIGTVSGLGIGASGVREVAKAFGEEDAAQAARVVAILRRMCWLTGLLGWLLAATLAIPVSRWVFGDAEHALAIALLGSTLLLGAIAGGQTALLQGVRRIGDLARINVYGMLINTVVVIGVYAWLRQDGIVPVLILTPAVSLGVAWWYARRIQLVPVNLGWRETFIGARQLLGLGSAFMWSGLLTAGLDMVTRSLITRDFGIDAAGQYQAAWALSGMFAGFILTAMGTDFYPRLTAVIDDHERAARTVNEQTEIGILLALPGLLITMVFAPYILVLFYSQQFLPAAQLLPWFLLGIFGRVISWPLGYIQLAQGASRWFAATETLFIGFQLALVIWLVPTLGAVGASYAFALTYFVYTLGMLWVGHKLIRFRWSPEAIRLVLVAGALTLSTMAVMHAEPGWGGLLIGGVIALAGCLISAKGLTIRLGQEHRVIQLLCRIPGGSYLQKLNIKV